MWRTTTGRNDLATAVLLRALHDAAFAGRMVLASAWWCTARGATAAETRGGTARSSAVRRSGCRPLRAAVPAALARWSLRAVPEDHWLDPRNVYAATKLSQEGLCAAYAREHPGRRHLAALPQRLRATDASRHALRRGGQHLSQRLRARRGPTGASRTAASVATSFTSPTSPAPTCWRSTNDEPAPGAFNVCTGRPTHDPRHGARAATPGGPTPQVVGGYRLGDIRHVFASADLAASFTRLPCGDPVRGTGCTSSPPARCDSVADAS